VHAQISLSTSRVHSWLFTVSNLSSIEMGRAGQGRAGQGRAGQGRAGQGRAGQILFGVQLTCVTGKTFFGSSGLQQ
jgi:hypothetical protein